MVTGKGLSAVGIKILDFPRVECQILETSLKFEKILNGDTKNRPIAHSFSNTPDAVILR